MINEEEENEDFNTIIEPEYYSSPLNIGVKAIFSSRLKKNMTNKCEASYESSQNDSFTFYTTIMFPSINNSETNSNLNNNNEYNEGKKILDFSIDKNDSISSLNSNFIKENEQKDNNSNTSSKILSCIKKKRKKRVNKSLFDFKGSELNGDNENNNKNKKHYNPNLRKSGKINTVKIDNEKGIIRNCLTLKYRNSAMKINDEKTYKNKEKEKGKGKGDEGEARLEKSKSLIDRTNKNRKKMGNERIYNRLKTCKYTSNKKEEKEDTKSTKMVKKKVTDKEENEPKKEDSEKKISLKYKIEEMKKDILKKKLRRIAKQIKNKKKRNNSFEKGKNSKSNNLNIGQKLLKKVFMEKQSSIFNFEDDNDEKENTMFERRMDQRKQTYSIGNSIRANIFKNKLLKKLNEKEKNKNIRNSMSRKDINFNFKLKDKLKKFKVKPEKVYTKRNSLNFDNESKGKTSVENKSEKDSKLKKKNKKKVEDFENALRHNKKKMQFNLFAQDKFTNTEFTDSDYLKYTLDCMDLILDIDISKQIKLKNKINFNFPKSKKKNIEKKIALFDLDETLVHCTGDIRTTKEKYQNVISIKLPGRQEIQVGINMRPYWKQTLNLIKKNYYIVVYTASHQAYADAVLDFMDPKKKFFKYRLYRNNCSLIDVDGSKFYVKDLDIFNLHYNLKDIIIVDNSVLSFAYHLHNGIPILPYYDEDKDGSLYVVGLYLMHIFNEEDLRKANEKHINLMSFLEEAKKKKEEESSEEEEETEDVQEKEKEEKMNLRKSTLLNVYIEVKDESQKNPIEPKQTIRLKKKSSLLNTIPEKINENNEDDDNDNDSNNENDNDNDNKCKSDNNPNSDVNEPTSPEKVIKNNPRLTRGMTIDYNRLLQHNKLLDMKSKLGYIRSNFYNAFKI